MNKHISGILTHPHAYIHSPWHDVGDREECPTFLLRKSGPIYMIQHCTIYMNTSSDTSSHDVPTFVWVVGQLSLSIYLCFLPRFHLLSFFPHSVFFLDEVFGNLMFASWSRPFVNFSTKVSVFESSKLYICNSQHNDSSKSNNKGYLH
jgi:hypothetical protein